MTTYDSRATSVFLLWLLPLSALWWIFERISGGYSLFTTALMWAPGCAALIATRHSTDADGLGWAFPAGKYLVLAFAIPVAYSLVAYGTLWETGLVPFNPAPLTDVARKMGLAALSAPLSLVVAATLTGTLGLLGGLLVGAIGEEIGWRGFLNPQLIARNGFLRGTLLTGSTWAAWHYPLFFGHGDSTPTLVRSLACFTVMVIGISFPLAWLREQSRSVWPASLFHAAHNLWIQRVLTPSAGASDRSDLLIDETGVALPIAAIITALLVLFVMSRRNGVAKETGAHVDR
jgi:uncharacterized protein